MLINRGEQRVTAGSVAADFEVDRRTIKRDIEFMRERLGVPIRWHGTCQTYYYTRHFPALPLFRLTEKDLTVLALANQRFAAWAGVSMAGVLRGIFKKFMAAAGNSSALPEAAAGDDFAPLTEFAAREQENLAPMWEATLRRREVQIAYRKRGATTTETRTIEPLHVDCPGRRWIVIARDRAHRDYRTFRLGRIRALEPTGKTFQVPADFEAAKFLRGSIGAYTGREEHEVRLLACDHAAVFAEEEGFHRSQTLVHRADGRVEVTLRLNNLVEIKYELLRWVGEVEVLSPASLRAAIGAAHRAALVPYEAGHDGPSPVSAGVKQPRPAETHGENQCHPSDNEPIP